MRAPVGALGEGRWGAFSESAEGTVRPARRSSPTWGAPGEVGMAGSEIQPYRKRAGGGCGRLGDPALPGGRRVRWGWPEDSIPIGRWQPVWRSESYLGDAVSGPSA